MSGLSVKWGHGVPPVLERNVKTHGNVYGARRRGSSDLDDRQQPTLQTIAATNDVLVPPGTHRNSRLALQPYSGSYPDGIMRAYEAFDGVPVAVGASPVYATASDDEAVVFVGFYPPVTQADALKFADDVALDPAAAMETLMAGRQMVSGVDFSHLVLVGTNLSFPVAKHFTPPKGGGKAADLRHIGRAWSSALVCNRCRGTRWADDCVSSRLCATGECVYRPPTAARCATDAPCGECRALGHTTANGRLAPAEALISAAPGLREFLRAERPLCLVDFVHSLRRIWGKSQDYFLLSGDELVSTHLLMALRSFAARPHEWVKHLSTKALRAKNRLCSQSVKASTKRSAPGALALVNPTGVAMFDNDRYLVVADFGQPAALIVVEYPRRAKAYGAPFDQSWTIWGITEALVTLPDGGGAAAPAHETAPRRRRRPERLAARRLRPLGVANVLLAGGDVAGDRDGALPHAQLDQPLGLVTSPHGRASVYVASAAGHCAGSVRLFNFGTTGLRKLMANLRAIGEACVLPDDYGYIRRNLGALPFDSVDAYRACTAGPTARPATAGTPTGTVLATELAPGQVVVVLAPASAYYDHCFMCRRRVATLWRCAHCVKSLCREHAKAADDGPPSASWTCGRRIAAAAGPEHRREIQDRWSLYQITGRGGVGLYRMRVGPPSTLSSRGDDGDGGGDDDDDADTLYFLGREPGGKDHPVAESLLRDSDGKFMDVSAALELAALAKHGAPERDSGAPRERAFDFSCAEVLEPSFVERGAVSIEKTVGVGDAASGVVHRRRARPRRARRSSSRRTPGAKTTPTTVATFQPEAFLAIDQFITLETPLSNVTPRSP
ncbi:hypothetical protein JL720_14294 [Aureococcus anophagefferens]|nr:hypothetical protein JL720_14294 [Aureococcus anophagefferens]